MTEMPPIKGVWNACKEDLEKADMVSAESRQRLILDSLVKNFNTLTCDDLNKIKYQLHEEVDGEEETDQRSFLLGYAVAVGQLSHYLVREKAFDQTVRELSDDEISVLGLMSGKKNYSFREDFFDELEINSQDLDDVLSGLLCKELVSTTVASPSTACFISLEGAAVLKARRALDEQPTKSVGKKRTSPVPNAIDNGPKG